jgi:peptidoglycan/xylan/chitin deacetylase (PgdA/CDA1 family)
MPIGPTGLVARSRAIVKLCKLLLGGTIVLAMGLTPGSAGAASPRNVDAVPIASRSTLGGSGGSGGAVAAIPPGRGVVGAEAPTVVFHGPRTDRVVALTFDDGYAPANVRRIFEELKRAHVAATFFVNGAYLRWDPKLWRSIAGAGYPIGNHTVLHEDVRGRAPGQVEADLIRNARLVLEVTGVPMIPVFRPPYGSHDDVSDAAAAAAGFPTIVLWDVTAGDSTLRAGDASVLASASAGLPGSIVLLHAGPSVTPRILPALIARYRARGFTFVTVPELLGIPSSTVLPPATGPSAAPDPGGAAAPTPPAIPPPGDDRGLPVSPGDAPLPSSMPTPTQAPGAGRAGAGSAAAPVPSPASWDAAPLPAKAGVSPVDASSAPLARDAAWTRGPARDGVMGVATVGLLASLLLLAALAGRKARRTG